MSWPSFDFDGARVLARKRSLAMSEGDSRRRRSSFVSFIERCETSSRRRRVVELDQPRPRHQTLSDGVSTVEQHQHTEQTPVKASKSRSMPVFDLSYQSPTLDNTLLRRVKQQARTTPPRQTKPPIDEQSPDLFSSASTPEHSPPPVGVVLQRPKDLSTRTPQRRPSRALKYPFSPKRPPVATTQPYSPLKRVVIDSQEERLELPHETGSAPVVSLDEPRMLEPLLEECSSNPKVASVSQRSCDSCDIIATTQSSSPPRNYSSSQDLFSSSSQSTQCSIVQISTPHASQQSAPLFDPSPVSSLNQELSNPEENLVEPLACTPPPLVEEADSTLRPKPDIDPCPVESQDAEGLLEKSQEDSLSIIQYDSQSPSQGDSSRCSSDRVLLEDCVSPVKTPTRSLFPSRGSGGSLTTVTEVNDVWERKGVPSKAHRLSKLAEALRRRMAMARSDVAMWKCEADTRQRPALRLRPDHSTLSQWGIQWTWCVQDGTPPHSVLVVDSQSIPSTAQGDRCLDLYQPLAQLQQDDSAGIVLLAPRYYTCRIIETDSKST